MKNLITRCNSITTTAVLTLWCCLAQADDIEVYRGGATGGSPVALLVLDTSGSMDRDVVVDDPDYDPSINYREDYPKKPNGQSIYYQFKTNLYYFGENNSDTSYLKARPFPKEALVCKPAIDIIDSSGTYSTPFKRWNPSTKVWDPSVDVKRSCGFLGWFTCWDSPENPLGSETDTNAIIECKSDQDTHPSNSYVNTNPSTSHQYRNYKVTDYDKTWQNNFGAVFSGNYLNYEEYIKYHFVNNTQSRMQITVDAAKNMVNTVGGLRMGLSRFNSSGNGGRIDIAVSEIEPMRTAFKNKLDSYIPPNGGTPLAESYFEAAQYLAGRKIIFGNDSTYTAKLNNSYYDSPITSGCQIISNIVLFTDGGPSGDQGANAYIETLLDEAGIDFKTQPGLTNEERAKLSNDCSNKDMNLPDGNKGDGSCAKELAYYLANVDQVPDLPGKQVFRTHTIGGFFDETQQSGQNVLKYMEDIAHFGKGTYSAATSKKEILDSFKSAVTVVLDDPVTFVAPSVAANAYNSLEHLDQLYYAMFVPSVDNNWQGNLKSYRLSPNGLVVDADGNEAIDKNSGLFKDTSRSYWTAEGIIDGEKVDVGGAASNLTKELKIFTHLSNNKGPLTQTISTTSIPKTMLGLENSVSNAEHSAVIDWLNRKTADGGTRKQMEDPLHSQPVVVNYGYSQDPTTNRITSDGVVFVGTNSGYLHAFKADKDHFEELFSFIPKELLGNANLYLKKDSEQPKAYGVDGPINYWHEDANQNLKVDDGEKVYLYFGLRRGGRHYYALDITDRDSPKFQWQISGGNGGAFDKMGQSWSPMTLAKVKWGDAGKTKVVLLFGGGYDAAEDNRDSRATSSVGNAVYMIDPANGDLLWSASNAGADTNLTDMTSSITSEIKLVDFDGDQITDYFFVSDIGGRVWRFDLNANKEAINKYNFIADSNKAAGMIFDAQQGSTNYQRFYDAPSVSYFSNPKTSEKFLTISIGSGYRASPLKTGSNDTKDSFYVIKDYDVSTVPTKYEAPLRKDFKSIPESSQVLKRDEVKVWKYDLPDGEKILSTPLTSNGNMYFTTFSPSTAAASSDSCNAEIGSSKVYYVDFMGDDDNASGSTGSSGSSSSPLISSGGLPNIGIPPAVVELNISEEGQKLFCEENPSHTSCQPPACEETGTCPDDCESTGSVILSGTHVVDGGTLRCDLLRKDYWRSL